MAKREFDASRARCDVCGELWVAGTDMHTVFSEFDEDIEDRDVLVKFRHYHCHKARDDNFKASMKSFDEASKRAQALLNEIRSKLR